MMMTMTMIMWTRSGLIMIVMVTGMTTMTILKTILAMEMSSVDFLGVDHYGDGDAGDNGKGGDFEDKNEDEDAFNQLALWGLIKMMMT